MLYKNTQNALQDREYIIRRELKMTYRDARKITRKANKKSEREIKRETNSLIRTLKADIKKTAKKGISEFHTKIRDTKLYQDAKGYLVSKGFRCWEYTMDSDKYLAIAW